MLSIIQFNFRIYVFLNIGYVRKVVYVDVGQGRLDLRIIERLLREPDDE